MCTVHTSTLATIPTNSVMKVCTDAAGRVLAASCCPGASTWHTVKWLVISCMSTWLNRVSKHVLSVKRKENLRVIHMKLISEWVFQQFLLAAGTLEIYMVVCIWTYGSVRHHERSGSQAGLLAESLSRCSGSLHTEFPHAPPEVQTYRRIHMIK